MYKFLAVDPGSGKCGLAVMTSDGAALGKLVAPAGNVAEAAADLANRFGGVDLVVVGSGTGGAAVADKLRAHAGLPSRAVLSPEQNTTLEARLLYERENPRPLPLRLIPRWLFAPPADLDAYAAVAIGLRYLKENPK
ncbi:MAG: pre-16S rRNA-processing nuclease YqgF [bacterium]